MEQAISHLRASTHSSTNFLLVNTDEANTGSSGAIMEWIQLMAC
ncbi:hypothetical protein EGR_07326 [Echinococcus granulosus]|uniref:Uncharacterized protein n=1 Tax=Echinococcus granulosus TaxID=6210 RepID=W6U9Z0_ECHGR|nr:hypothetical protein EGR_07326 [Echinococcus granulosus]EUB57855.1 hypothetical protein EGR_07326 [Echinococcus granulosus]